MTAMEPADTRPGVALPVRLLLTVVGGVLWSAGWLARKTLLAVAWMAAAVRLGWADAGSRRR